FPLIHLAETDSTNRYLQDLCAHEEVKEMTTVTADYQTSGRGQRGNSWEGAPGQNLLFSVVLYPVFLEANQQFLISQIVTLAIKEGLEQYTDEVSIKWPNDIYWREKKICGILIENDLMGRHISRSIAGIGLNINQERFESLAPNPVSLRQITGKAHDLQEVLQGILQRLHFYYEQLRRGEAETVSTLYKASLFRREGFHPYKDANGIFQARIFNIEPDGKLILEDADGHRRDYIFKEVEYLLT
ncbi:MAG: biotin--[acetyl-CoA-carboxylase] ligase, partial [Mediterranea sp.]|nr:biotin--[acetyl-CoA-carboxylase] ligase [Mediterranea sp.]